MYDNYSNGVFDVDYVTGTAQKLDPELDTKTEIYFPSVSVNDSMSGSSTVATTDRVLGVDVSYWEGKIDWEAYYRANVRFGTARATSGETYEDSTYLPNIVGMRNAGVKTGSYHYFIGSQDPIKQARHYFKVAGDQDLPPCLDLEGTNNRNISISRMQANTLACLKEMEKLFKKRPMIYTAKYVFAELLGNLDLSSYDLWVANYQVSNPQLPTPWKSWKVWQFTDRYQVANTTPDGNWFNGNIAEFNKWLGTEEVTEPTDKKKLDKLWETHPEIH